VGANPINWIDPSGMDAIGEEAEIDLNVSEGATEGEQAAAKEISCVLDTASSLLAVLDPDTPFDSILTLSTLAINAAQCDAEGTYEEEEPGGPPHSEEGGFCPQCFAAGTPIHTSTGDVPVEKIKVGDEVVARNGKTGKSESEPVTALVPPHQGKLLEIRVEGERTPLRPSTGHPFWARRNGHLNGEWIEAGKIQRGDLLQTDQGDWRMVTAIRPLRQEETVYNFTVAKDHDYFVGQTGFLVHNARCNCSLTPPGGPSFPGTSGPWSSRAWNSVFAGIVKQRVGPLGDPFPEVDWPIGSCAEFDAANNAMNAGWQFENGIWTPVTKGPRIIPPCPICQKMFGLIP
jgi:Pretoxin HINT domain